MISNLLFLSLGVIVGGFVWPALRPFYEMALQRAYQRAMGWRMRRHERRERKRNEQASAKLAEKYTNRPATRSPRTHTLRRRREMTRASRQEQRDKRESLKKLKQRRNRGRIPLSVRVAPKGWRREDAA